MTHGSLFSGIGGFDLAAEWMGWENKFHCEWNQFGQRILKYYWPNAKSYHDITKTDFTIHRGGIDILTGGFPCQPYSAAGKRRGKEDDRHLWPEMLRAIREIRPRWVVGENVRGLVNWSGGLVFDEVQSDLENEGYTVFPFLLPACGVNAPHRRERIWFVAHSKNIDANRFRRNNDNRQPLNTCKREGIWGQLKHISEQRFTTNPNSNGQHRGNSKHEINTGEGREYAQRDIEQMGGDVTDLHNPRLERRKINGSTGTIRQKPHKQPAGHFCTSWQNFPTQSPICTGNDGIPAGLDGITFSKWRNESIKAAGNAIVPQVALQIFKSIQQYEQL